MAEDIYNNSEYMDKNPSWHVEHSAWKADQVKKIINQNDLTLNKIIEVGCGAGEILVNLSKDYPNRKFIGYEISKEIFAIAKNKESENVEFIYGNITDESNYSDLILCIDVFEHVENYLSFLKELKHHSKYHIFHIPLDINVLGLFRNRLIKERISVGHLHYFTFETAIATLEDCGYQIVDWNFTDSFYKGGLEHPSNIKSKILRYFQGLIYSISPKLLSKTLGGLSLIVLTK
tara:strand:+ start:384 stop:1082 length:699 start_codon:yes stop_codon:yes gene_type:complete